MVREMVSDLMMEIEEEKNSYNQYSIWTLSKENEVNLITFKGMREHSNPGNTLRDFSDGKENKVMKE